MKKRVIIRGVQVMVVVGAISLVSSITTSSPSYGDWYNNFKEEQERRDASYERFENRVHRMKENEKKYREDTHNDCGSKRNYTVNNYNYYKVNPLSRGYDQDDGRNLYKELLKARGK